MAPARPQEGAPPRLAAADAGSVRAGPRGSNHTGMRQFNERVVLQAIRLNGSLPKAAIARATHLTPQTVQVIIARLEADALVRKLEPVRGKVGQPSVPMALNADGAFSIGIKIGRRSLDLLLLDFLGAVRDRSTLAYGFPDAHTLFDRMAERLLALQHTLPAPLRSRLHGVGVAAPLSIGGWQSLLAVRPRQAAEWAGIDIRERVGSMTDLPVAFVKDTAAACVAELVAGRGRSIGHFLYVFVDTFIGGGLVIEGRLHGGLNGNGGAIGSLALGVPNAGDPRPSPQLLSRASLIKLENAYLAAGLEPGALADGRALQPPWSGLTGAWLNEAAPAIALAIHAAACLLDLGTVVVDGTAGPPLLEAVIAGVARALDHCDWQGVARPVVLPGTVGPDASAIGGALLPLYANFAPDPELFLKLTG